MYLKRTDMFSFLNSQLFITELYFKINIKILKLILKLIYNH